MGDVYDALNRGRQTTEEEPAPLLQHRREETGGLPMEQVEDAARLAPGKSVFADRSLDHAFGMSDPHSPAADPRHRPQVRGGCMPGVVAHTDRTSPVTEQYRQIRTQILARNKERKRQTHLLTSSAPQEGKSVTTVNLGVVFAELHDMRTLLIEADLRRPTFQRLFQCPFVTGLTHVLRGDIEDEREVIHPTIYENLHVLPAGEHDGEHAAELLASRAMVRLLDRLKDHYDHILIDSPPAISVTDACVLGALCDETILVVRLHRTPRDVVRQAKRQLETAGCTMAGSIVTHAQPDQLPRYVHQSESA